MRVTSNHWVATYSTTRFGLLQQQTIKRDGEICRSWNFLMTISGTSVSLHLIFFVLKKMHRFLKFLLLLILLWTFTLPWTLSYLSTLTSLSDNAGTGSDVWFRKHFQTGKHITAFKNEKVVVGVVACGEKAVNETIVLLKSVILSGIFYGLPTLDAILFADDDNLFNLDTKVEQLKDSVANKPFHFRYEIHPVIFPVKNNDEWKALFKPCASQRLFLHTALPHIDKILYLDVDTLVVGNILDVWKYFMKMSSEQSVGLVPEHEVSSIGWYNRFAMHPFYPPMGVNTGVMLMNLTKLRGEMDWEDSLLKTYKTYKEKIVFGDQDLMNIMFYHKPDAVYLLPCSFNYRPDHCQYGWNCPTPALSNGIQILHGNRNVFHNETLCPMFAKVYKLFSHFEMNKQDYLKDLILPFKREIDKQPDHTKEDPKTNSPNCDQIDQIIFTNI